MVVGIAEGYGALKIALDIAKGLKDINDQVKLNGAVIELQSKILEAQESVSNARERLSSLEQELQALNDWQKTAARYSLVEFGANRFCYQIREECRGEEPFHRLCPSCFEGHKRSIIQFGHTSLMGEHFKCPTCSTAYVFGNQKPMPPVNRPGGRW